jgi:hypothetical protein
VQQASAALNGDTRLSTEGLELTLRDQPGAYAYEDSTQAQRIAQRQLNFRTSCYESSGQHTTTAAPSSPTHNPARATRRAPRLSDRAW